MQPCIVFKSCLALVSLVLRITGKCGLFGFVNGKANLKRFMEAKKWYDFLHMLASPKQYRPTVGPINS